jgi:hypothetical protein
LENRLLIRNLPPQSPTNPILTKDWIKEIASIGEKTKKEARIIVQKYTNKNIQNAIKHI